jgi:hypothetical protein
MNAELELANRKIAELETRLKALMEANEQLMLLPNGDLHRGLKLEDANRPNIDVEVIPETFGNPLNVKMAEILRAAKGGHALTCLWCGLQYNGHGAEKDMREHLKKDHASVVEGHDRIVPELLMANLEEAKARLAEAEAAKE